MLQVVTLRLPAHHRVSAHRILLLQAPALLRQVLAVFQLGHSVEAHTVAQATVQMQHTLTYNAAAA